MPYFTLESTYYQELIEDFRHYLHTRGYGRSSCYNLPRQAAEFLYFLEQQGTRGLSLVEAPQIEAFLAYLQSRGHRQVGGPLGAAYLNKYLQALKRLAAYLREAENITLSIPFSNFKKEERPTLVLNREEIEALYSVCRYDALGKRDRAMLALYYGCGLRSEEGERLQTQDVQADRGLLYVRPGKNGRDRYVPLTGRVRQDLLAYRDQARPLLMTTGESTAFLVRSPGQAVQGQSLRARLRKLVLAAGITQDIGLHSLRHSIATHLWQAGMPLSQISRFLGHRSLESTQVYTHLPAKEEVNR